MYTSQRYEESSCGGATHLAGTRPARCIEIAVIFYRSASCTRRRLLFVLRSDAPMSVRVPSWTSPHGRHTCTGRGIIWL